MVRLLRLLKLLRILRGLRVFERWEARLAMEAKTEVWKTVETKCLPLQKRRPGRKALK